MSYLSLARKYRPQTFAELIGQPHVTTTLTRALEQGRIAHAYLFAGLRGVGKTSAARILAKCLNCEKGPTAQPCHACASCTQIPAGSSLDVTEIDGASNRGIDEIRRLRESVPYAPTGGAFHVYIIDEVHMLTAEAFNALLKTLEEPPAHVTFILATTEPTKVPATILSRCQRFDFRRIEVAALVEALQRVATLEQIRVEEAASYAIARASEGSLRDAEVILEQLASFAQGPITEAEVTALLGAVESEALFAWTDAILNREATQTLQVCMDQLEQGKDASQLLTGLLRHLRNLVVVSSAPEGPSGQDLVARLVDEPSDRLTRLREQARRTSLQELLMLLQLLTGAYEMVRRSPMAQTILELALIKVATRDAWQSLEDISRRLQQLKAEAGPDEPSRATEGAAASGEPGGRDKPASESLSPSVQASARVAQASASVASGMTGLAQPAHGEEPVGAAAAGGDAPDDWPKRWPEFLSRLGAQKMSLAAYLSDAKPTAFADGLVTIGLPAFSLHEEVLSTVESQRLIEHVLSELCQRPIRVRYATLPEPASSEPGQERPAKVYPSIVQEIVTFFNATVIDRPQSP